MKAAAAKQRQSELKKRYAHNPESAIADLSAVGDVDFDNLQFNIRNPNFLSPAGLHELSGGDQTAACPVEIMLAGWAGCAGVTFAAVANSMRLEIKNCEVTATGRMDFRGTLAVDKESPVGLTRLKLTFKIDSQEPVESIEKLVKLTERYCVVHQTLAKPPEIVVDLTKN